MRFRCNPQINFCLFFLQFELSQFLARHIDTRYLVKATPTILAGFFEIMQVFWSRSEDVNKILL